jgi:hypothetical protein
MATYMMLVVGATEEEASLFLTQAEIKQVFDSVPEPWRHTARLVVEHLGNTAILNLLATLPDTCPDQFHGGWSTLERADED